MIRRNTPTKEAILNLLAKTGKAMSQDSIEQKTKINPVTIYRVLNRFCEDGILHKVIGENGKQYFAVCIKCNEKKLAVNHFHFCCTICKTIECLQEAVSFSVPNGYHVQDVNCVLTGICPKCL